ncbi:MAG: Maf family protein [Planctomycetota bacterium]
MNTASCLILASQSPRRAQLLTEAGFAFEQRSPPFADPDQPPGHLGRDEAEGYAVALAEMKALSLDEAVIPSLVLAADTICVDAAGQLVGKPRDRAHAAEMIRAFSGSEHRVITGVALLRVGVDQSILDLEADTAVVRFRTITAEQIDDYLATEDWRGKAGGYNLFDRQAAGWPIEVEGDPTTVVGLPMKRLVPMLNTLLDGDALS